MAITSEIIKNAYISDGQTTNFIYTFRVYADTEIGVNVTIDGVTHTLTHITDYDVVRNENNQGGRIVLVSPDLAPNQSTLSILSAMPYLQTTVYIEGDKFPAKSHEDALDKLTIQILQLNEKINTGGVVIDEIDGGTW